MAVTTMPSQLPRAAFPPLPEEWTFWADTIVGAVPLGPVQATAFSCVRKLSDFGSGSVTLPVESTALNQERLLRLWSWRLWAFYAGVPYFCGVPTGITDDGSAVTTLTLTELTGYLTKRQWDVQDMSHTQTEQTEIARQIASPLADVGVDIVTEPGSGFLRDRSYAYLESEHRGQLLINLSQVISGPQFRTEYSMSPAGRPVCTLRVAYPRVGTATGLGMTVPGSVTGFSAAWDSDKLRTRTFAVGELAEDAPEGTPKPAVIEDRPQPDLPRLDEADDWAGVILTSTLTERANTAATQYASPVLDLGETGSLDDPPVTTYGPGDDVTVRIVTPLLSGGIEETAQLTECTVDAGTGTAAWKVTATLPPPQARQTLNQRLDQIDRLVIAARRQGLAPLT